MSFEKLKEKTTESIMNDLRKTMLNDNGLEFKGSILKEVALKKWVAKDDVLVFLKEQEEKVERILKGIDRRIKVLMDINKKTKKEVDILVNSGIILQLVGVKKCIKEVFGIEKKRGVKK